MDKILDWKNLFQETVFYSGRNNLSKQRNIIEFLKRPLSTWRSTGTFEERAEFANEEVSRSPVGGFKWHWTSAARMPTSI